MGQFTDSVRQVAKNYTKYNDWEQNQADIRVRKEALLQNKSLPQDKLDKLKQRTETVVRATEIMDARSEDNCEDMEQYTGIVAAIPAMGIQLVQIPVSQAINTKIDAKYQSKIDELRLQIKKTDNSNRLKQLQEELNQLRNKASKETIRAQKYTTFGFPALAFMFAIGMILWGNKKQKEASRIGRYQAKQNELKGLENFVEYTPEQIAQAEEIASKIPDEKEKKKNIGKIISGLKDIKKDKSAYKDWLSQKDPDEFEKLKQAKFSPENLEKAKEDKELIVNVVKDINIKAEEYSENLENAYDTFNSISLLLSAPLGLGINKILKLCKVSNKANRVVSILTPVLVDLIIGIYGTIAQKQAARVGRYVARKDLTENPQMLMAYSEEDMKQVKDVKAEPQKIGFFQKIGQSFKFILTYQKDKAEYKKYKETKQKQNEKLQTAFKEIEVTDKQKEDAKLLQTNVFRAFDEVDEMSQRYSEDIEAGCEIAKNMISSIWTIGTASVIAWFGIALSKGKLPIVKWGNKLCNWTFDKNSSIRKALNNFAEVLSKKDKKTVQKFQNALIHGNMKKYIKNPENAEIVSALNPLKGEIETIGVDALTKVLETPGDLTKGAAKNFLSGHLKQTAVAKWVRNILGNVLKLKTSSIAEKNGVELTADMKKKLGLNFTYDNYKTLINTGIVAGIPVLGIIFSVPYAVNAWFTNIQKKAGKIGIMQAMQNLDDPRLFAKQEEAEKIS